MTLSYGVLVHETDTGVEASAPFCRVEPAKRIGFRAHACQKREVWGFSRVEPRRRRV